MCEAASRPTIREQQILAARRRSRDLPIENRTMLVNALRTHLTEFGFIAAKASASCRKAK